MKTTSVVLSVVAVLGLTSCATTQEDCDPNQRGLGAAVSGVLSGCYQEQTDRQVATLRGEQEQVRQLQMEQAQSAREVRQREQELSRLKRQLVQVHDEQTQLEQQLQRAKSKGTPRHEVEHLEKEVAALRREREELENLVLELSGM